MKIQFTDVGRDKKSWVATIAELTEDALRKCVRGELMSREPDFEMRTETEGLIFAGMRTVGTFKIIEDVAAN